MVMVFRTDEVFIYILVHKLKLTLDKSRLELARVYVYCEAKKVVSGYGKCNQGKKLRKAGAAIVDE